MQHGKDFKGRTRTCGGVMRSSCLGFLPTSRSRRRFGELTTRLWPHHQYSPHLGNCDSFLLPRIKRRRCFQDVPEIQEHRASYTRFQKDSRCRNAKAVTKLSKCTALKVTTTTAIPSLPGSHTEDLPPTGIILTPCTTHPEFKPDTR
jgi:hypothetical protein